MSENEFIGIRVSSLESPFVTVAIPTYRRAGLLMEAVGSVLDQHGFSNYEVLVCDNNPDRDDETEMLMSSYSDPRISYYKNTANIGIVGNWNRLYRLARGEWVVMLHDDDMLAPFFLDYIFNKREIHKKGDLIFPAFTSRRSLFMKPDSNSDRRLTCPKIIDLIQFNLIGPPVGMAIRKDTYEEIGGFSTRFYPSPDYHFYVDALLKKKRIVKLLGDPMAFYRIEVNVSMRPETQIGFIKNGYDIGRYIIDKSPAILSPFIRCYCKVSSYNTAKCKQKVFPDNGILKDIIKGTEPNLPQRILAKFLFRAMHYRRKLCFPKLVSQYERD